MRVTSITIVLFAAACATNAPSGGDQDPNDTTGGDTTNPPGQGGGGDGTGSGSGSGTGTGSGSGSNPGTPSGVGPYFTAPMFFNRDVSAAPKAANSSAMIAALRAEGGWGNGDKMQIDFSIDVLTTDNSAPMKSFTKTGDFFSPDCDFTPVPIPANGNVESSTSYQCGGGDCHLIVYQKDTKKLYEMWRANIVGSTFTGGCLAVWDGTKQYGDIGRGQQCTSADAAGFPIAPLLFNADEVAAGHIDHAIRFILPNDRPKRGYVPPATHGTNTTGGADAPYYGVHLRLRANYPVDSLPTEGAKVVARALQKYGMYHADGGRVALTAQNDRNTTAKWSGLLAERDLQALKVEDFEVIDHGAVLPFGYNCARK